MTDDDLAIASWWTPRFWLTKPEPAPYHKWRTNEALEFKDSGYVSHLTIGDSFEIELWKAPDHLLVRISSFDDCLSTFFVNEDDQAAFFVDKLPDMLRGYDLSINKDLFLLRKAIVAFIRHGHGLSTISEDGEIDKDDDDHQRRMEAYRRSQKAQP